MTKYVAVVPFVHQRTYDECADTIKFTHVPIDNTVNNRGIMRSHNIGVDIMNAAGADWLVIVSAALRFGRAGGQDFIETLGMMKAYDVVEAAGVYGWHLIAFHAATLDRVGYWDENFSPYGFDDLDLAWRIQLAFGAPHGKVLLGGRMPRWEKIPVDVIDTGMAHSVKLKPALVATADPDKQLAYYERKWGGRSGSEIFHHPFNDPSKPISYWREGDL